MTTRSFQIVAQDPNVRTSTNCVLTAKINLPSEELLPGPLGYALHVVDYDASTATMYKECQPPNGDVVAPENIGELLADPGYHALNAYAIAMRTLLRFEFALGRRVGWGIHGHQLKIVPHAFEGANAFYSPNQEALLFGYVRGKEPMFLCLSHDVVAHETAHALLDGLRDKFMSPSSPDQAALHEAFADIVALLSVFSLPEVVKHVIRSAKRPKGVPEGFARKSALSWRWLTGTALLGLAEGMRDDGSDLRANALRRSIDIKPHQRILDQLEFQEEHRRGEILVAAVLRAFVQAWITRIQQLGGGRDGLVDLGLVAEQGADIADLLLTMAIRAVDYTPPIHIEFADFLSAMLTADTQVRADDRRYELRKHLIASMADYGIKPRSRAADGCWPTPSRALARGDAHFLSLQSDPTEMFRHVWSNREALQLNPNAFTRIASIRPCLRVSPEDGFQIRETVVECVQWLNVSASELRQVYGLSKPRGMPGETQIVLEAGSTLVLDEYGMLKFEISNLLPNVETSKAAWSRRIKYLWDEGYLGDSNRSSRLDSLHLERALIEDERLAAARQRAVHESWR